MKSEDEEVDWIDFDPENDPRIRKVPSPSKHTYEGDSCSVVFAIGFILFLLVFALLAFMAQG